MSQKSFPCVKKCRENMAATWYLLKIINPFQTGDLLKGANPNGADQSVRCHRLKRHLNRALHCLVTRFLMQNTLKKSHKTRKIEMIKMKTSIGKKKVKIQTFLSNRNIQKSEIAVKIIPAGVSYMYTDGTGYSLAGT